MGGRERFEVSEQVLDWKAQDQISPWQHFPSIARRLAYVVLDDRLDSPSGGVSQTAAGVSISGTLALAGIPIRNGSVQVNAHLDGEPLAVTLRDTDAFGEVLFYIVPAEGKIDAWSITIDRVLKGGVSYPSPRPEEQIATPIGSFEVKPIPPGWHWIEVEAVEERILLKIDGLDAAEVSDPDVGGGMFGLAAAGMLQARSVWQLEYISKAEKRRRDRFVREMTAFCKTLDSEQQADIVSANRVSCGKGRLEWSYPETGARLVLTSGPRKVTSEGFAGLYGDPRMLLGAFAQPQVHTACGQVLGPKAGALPEIKAWQTGFSIRTELAPLPAEFRFEASLTENATWFCTAEVTGVDVSSAAVAFGLDPDFRPISSATAKAGEPARMVYGTSAVAGESGKQAAVDSSRLGFGLPPKDLSELPSSFVCTDGKTGHCWSALTGHDTAMETRSVDGKPVLLLRSQRNRFRWAMMWLPYHSLNLTGYKKRMVHFIRQAEVPVQQWRERPDAGVYPSDEELARYASNGTKAMVWHHPWAHSNFRERDGFVVNRREMKRAMATAHRLGIQVLPYIGIVPGRHPALRYEDLSQRMGFDKNWDLQDFTLYSVAGRFQDFFPYITDKWIREYGIDGFYTDGGLALLDWGRTGLNEEQAGLSLEEMNDRLYSRVKRVLRRHGGRFGLENWGAAGVHLAGPWYDCRMIGEAFQETSPESYRDIYNPLVTGTPFKMYGMDLVARSRYNIAMAAVCMTDIQMCSGNYSWGNWPDRPSDWANVGPFWKVLDSIDWDDLLEARPWWAQELIEGDGFYAGYYLTPERLVLFLANREEAAKSVSARIRLDRLPTKLRSGKIRSLYPEQGEWTPVGAGTLSADLPKLHDGQVGWELVP